MPADPFSFTVAEEYDGIRLDRFLAEQLTQYSRVKLRVAITEGQVLVDGKRAKPAYRLITNQRVVSRIVLNPDPQPEPEDIPIRILYEDESIVVVDKSPGMVVHPSKGHWSGTLTAAISFHFQNLSTVGGPQRPGIVHRLDRDTSGVIVIARDDSAHVKLASQFEERSVEKEYFAVISPPPDRERDWIDQPIGPHPSQREKMAVRQGHLRAKEAQTFYEITGRYGRYATVRVRPKTGRTHQIRVHFSHIGCPVVADKLYSGTKQITRKNLIGGRSLKTAGVTPEPDHPRLTTDPEQVILNRQALHAHRLCINHPVSGKRLEFVAEIPADLQQLVSALAEINHQ
ncbi:MAG: RluA family pseudouridine synthase [Pirellulaceae bacterium]|nr:RluA family pseudouridine synthase [Pirellulaceae bacterium]